MANLEALVARRPRAVVDGAFSFLVDRRGVIRHVQPGGKLAPNTDDFRVMRPKIEQLLLSPPSPSDETLPVANPR
ncbi:MAG: hypothetical protein ACRET7_09180 [Burkholderiales bacterium]